MITRFDHAVIAVPDIDAAIATYSDLGFSVAAGGRHSSIGTRNAVVRFGLDYLELLAVEDGARARASGPFGAELAAFLDAGPGLVGFVLASSRLEDEAAGLDRIGHAYAGPFPMDRERPDGRRLAWRLVVPGRSPWRKPWPFLIEWETPDADRLAWDGETKHPNRVCGVAGVELLVDDLASARRFYEDALALEPAEVDVHTCHYGLGDFELCVSAARDPAMTRELRERGPGPFRLLLRSEGAAAGAGAVDPVRTHAAIEPVNFDIEPADALGARVRVSG